MFLRLGFFICSLSTLAERDGYTFASLIELEIVSCVVVRDVLHHTGEALHIVRQQALLHVIAEKIAEQTTEILVAWIAEERTGVGQHTYEAAQEAEHREGIHLPGHTIELVVEPPA